MAASQQQYGMTPPISMEPPKPHETALSDSMIAELKEQNSYESAEETQKRTEVLNTLQRVAQQLVQLVGKKKGIPPNILESAGGRVVPYGSFRLGVYGPGSDIDTLMVGPKHVHRNDFFEHMRELITKAFGADAIGEFTPVTDTSVPIIKTKLVGISIDLIYCSLMVSSVPAGLELTDNALLKGLDETDLRCVNGTRVTDMILQLVPQGKTFRHALRAVKHWAKQRAIYGNIVGFPGGVAWAMMVARICQLYPRATGSLIVSRFFHIMKSWKWPQPVLLTQVDSGPPGIAKVWNPKIYPGDKRHIMPVITPAFPSMCATHNVGHSTLMVIQRELNRASELVNGIFAGTKQWKDLFIPHTFFSEGYKHYISVNSASRTKEAQEIWSGFVESRLRRLVTGLETSQTSVQLAHPFMKGFKRVHHCKNDEEIDAVLQGSLQFQAKDSKTETTDDAKYAKQQAAAQEGSAEKLEMPAAQVESNGDGTESIHTTTFYVGIGLEKDAKQLDISWPIQDFKRTCTDWDQFDSALNSIRVVHIRNYDLPDDVFRPGEPRPQRSKKTKTQKPTSNKRSFATTDLDENQDPNAAKRRQSNATPATNGAKPTS